MNNIEKKFGMKIIDMNFSYDKPVVKKVNSKDWVIWGTDNLFPQYLLDLFHNRSISHKQIINRKVKMISSAGIDKPSNPSKEYTSFIENKFGDMSIDEMIIKMAYDLVIFNGISLNPHWNVDNSGITRICYIPFERVRQDKYNSEEDNGLPKYVWICNDWMNWRKDEPSKYVMFDQKWINDKSQIFYYMGTDQGIKWYPDVEYSPSINYIEAAWEIGNYHNNSIKNGFHAGFVLNFATGIPTEEEMERAYEDISSQFTGTNNANKFILAWSNGSDGAPQLLPIPTNTSDTKYVELNNLIRDNIFEAHEVINPNLFGVATPGQLSGRNELLESLALYQSTYVDGKQKVIEDILNKFAALYGVDTTKEPIKLKKYMLNIPDVADVPKLTINDVILLQGSISSGQISPEAALDILTIIYELDENKAKKLLKMPIQNNNI